MLRGLKQVMHACAPLAKVNVDAGHSEGVGRVGVSRHNGHVVVGKANAQIRKRAGIDHADAVCLASLHCHILPLAACRCSRVR